MGNKSKIRGVAQLRSAMGRLKALSDGESMEPAAVAGMLLIINQAKINAPFLSGTLRRSLHVGGQTDMTPDWVGSGDDTSYGDLGPGETGPTRVVIKGGSNLIYSGPQETRFGYLRAAFDAERAAAVEEVRVVYGALLAGGVG